ncbi:NAD(P)-dependent glycerol-3-phosphate dehydrogenase [Roseospira marina]|uniref:Glycerol-3-phosphate dehydrogenase [NAD(P)+] n=1 Tax=Roseospira marina TaxID=140057 RepID=A0A5M6IHR2_9PROT|nr:NAD(P)H-dependent glycerol-3-phosphate dehydrogenase [Roseospira marina]KAA5607487.1 NAD(P)-dependent glycerol-3-phosphate dehydrogenase [Roseospira marina]MBB4312332.1 glycerol-3-phosphate dehydrogenase (NAD(P)+) [Roseospira marina]MBB5085652.1 glycerol-3-phosphate dehydrogenase (NAD(P)+) [Roseospira marina]
MSHSIEHIGILGGGAWGTALASSARRAGRPVSLWAREPEVVAAIRANNANPDFLPGVDLPEGIDATTDATAVVARADAVLLVTPAQAVRATCTALAPHWRPGVPVVICAKGLETATGAMMGDVVADALPMAPLAVLSGPTFASEVGRGCPTALTLACADRALGEALVHALGTPTFRPYWSDDVTGVQVGGAVKNVLAIACGIVEGRGLGDNARAALVTRGLAELSRLAGALGGRPDTLMGLSGLGDLLLTATSMQSRNYSLGVALGEGRTLAEVLGERRSVAEGVHTARAVAEMGIRLGVDLPISAAVDAVLNQDADLDRAIVGLLSRPFRPEPDHNS